MYSLCRSFSESINILKVRNVVLIIIRFLGIFYIFGYLRWFLYIRLVSSVGSIVTGFTIFTLYIVDSLALFFGGILADRYGRRVILIVGSIILTIGLLLLLSYMLFFNEIFILIITLIVLFGLGNFDDAATYAILSESVSKNQISSVVTIFKIIRLIMFSLGSITIPLLGVQVLQIISIT